MAQDRIFTTSFASVYPMYVAKTEKKDRIKEEANEIICWLTGYSRAELEYQLQKQVTFEQFFAGAPAPNPSRSLIIGVVRGVRIEDIEDNLVKKIRYLDKMIDELAKGKKMEKTLRS